MSPWTETTRATWPLYPGVGVIAFGMVVGYLLMSGLVAGGGEGATRDARTPGPVASSRPSDTATEDVTEDSEDPQRTALDVVSWGHANGQLAVVVRNETGRLIESMRVRISALDGDGETLMSTTGSAGDVCCTILGLPPEGYFGLFADAQPTLADHIGDVVVEPATSSFEQGDASAPTRVHVEYASLLRTADDAVVTARLRTSRGRAFSGYVAAQAFLVRPNGRVAQVISGRFYCFAPGETREVWMELLHPAPPGLRLDLVVAYAIPAGVAPHVPWECDEGGPG
ncbi:hypothetical protein HNR19_002131 [Nocardioides thalensis]|uniref:Uncharacterized protein n=1 Tax=Nocardioides thalensis TaxID=1914755 RepID=A0A853C593_9ACTN|nr:hypothetical protein [Nocardioides thalensis]NYJ01433.1 hypothetical protein [Nocardioides thalensis]